MANVNFTGHSAEGSFSLDTIGRDPIYTGFNFTSLNKKLT
jgi:hypothetical protein